MFSRSIAAIAAVTVLLGGAIALASPKSPLPHLFAQAPTESPRRMQGEWLKDLNLSSDQMQKIQTIRSRYKDQLSQQRQAAQQAQQELRTLMVGSATPEEIRQKYKQAATLRSQLMETRFNSLLEIREILTPDQRQKFANRLDKTRKSIHERIRNRMGQQLRGEPMHDSPLSLEI